MEKPLRRMFQSVQSKIKQWWQQTFIHERDAEGQLTKVYLYKRLLTYFKPYWFRAILALSITVPIGALDGSIAYVLKPYVDTMQAKATMTQVSFVPFAIVGFTLIQGLLNYLSIYLNGWLGAKVLNDVRKQMFDRLQQLDISYFDNHPSGHIIQHFFQDPAAINTSILTNLKSMLTRLFSSLFLIGVLVHTSLPLSIIAVVMMGFILFPSTRIRAIIKELSRQTVSLSSNVLSFYSETAQGARVIYGFNYAEERSKRFNEFQKGLFDVSIKSTQAQGWLTPSMHVISSIGIAVIIWQGSVMVVNKDLTTGGFVSFLAAMLMLYNPIKNLGGSILATQLSMLAVARIFYTMDINPEIKDKPDAITVDGFKQQFEFKDVIFSYVPRENQEVGTTVLRDFNLTIQKGETLAIVGPSGGGKSTIVSLLPRFYEIYYGQILMDGVNIKDITLDSLRRQFAIVAQDNFLFDGTIADNLKVGKPTATEEDMWLALEQAYLKEFVQGLPDGLQARVGERGVQVSGGQRQRLAIARAILKDAPIIILDEATSALDSQSEAMVQKAMEALTQNKTVIVIAHRLSTVHNADRIVVITEGKIAEMGTHEALIQQNGLYSLLYQQQFKDPLPTLEEGIAEPALVLAS